VWLGYVTEPGARRPVTLTLSGATSAEHVFADRALGRTGREQIERDRPVRFESDLDAMRMQSGGRPTVSPSSTRDKAPVSSRSPTSSVRTSSVG
jgi:hypothetical protein